MIKPRIRIAGVVDVETSGLGKYSEIIELSLVVFGFNADSGEVTGIMDEYCGLREPSGYINPWATRVHGLTLADVRGHRLDHARIEDMISRTEFLIAHNASFDRGYVAAMYPSAAVKPWYCSMAGVNWKAQGCPNRRLQDLLYFHHIDPGQAHRALDDARATLMLLAYTQPNGETNLKELLHKYEEKEENRRKENPVSGFPLNSQF
ncbi:MAG: exonuclease domain-containing protein [Chitinophagales bacterium]